MLGLDCLAKCTEDNINKFFGRFQFLFNFATEKFVIIRDWRLGLVLRILQVAIFIYILTDIIQRASYLQTEVPKGVISPGTTFTQRTRRLNLQEQAQKYTNNTLPYCNSNNTLYDYKYNGIEFSNIQCVVQDPISLGRQTESTFFLTTFLRLDKVFYVQVAPDTECPAPKSISSLPSGSRKIGKNIFDVCLYNLAVQNFAIAPEEYPLSIFHSYYATIVDKSGSLPETILLAPNYPDGGKRSFKEDRNINLSIKDLLDLVGVDLDKKMDEQPNGAVPPTASKDAKEEEFPFVRLSGINIVMSFRYYSRALEPGDYNQPTGKKSKRIICIVELKPQYTWSSDAIDVRQQLDQPDDPFLINPEGDRLPAGSDPVLRSVQVDYQRYGITLSFQVSGNLGIFSVFSLIDALVSGAVLLSVAQVIVTYIALYALGLSSMLYMEYMRESVNWRKEYARFAAQSLVAGSTFMKFDTNNSDELDRAEIYKYLCEVLERILDKKHIACLTDFLMRHGENEEADVSRGRLDEIADIKISTINMAEWVDIFTEEKVKINSLERLVSSEYKDEKIIETLQRLAEGKNLRGITGIASEDIERLVKSGQERLLEEGNGRSEAKKDGEGVMP